MPDPSSTLEELQAMITGAFAAAETSRRAVLSQTVAYRQAQLGTLRQIRDHIESDGPLATLLDEQIEMTGSVLESAREVLHLVTGCEVSPRTIDFGPVVAGQFAEAAVTVTNGGGRPFTLKVVGSSHPAFIVVSPTQPVMVNPGELVTVTVRFSCGETAAGSQNGSLTFQVETEAGSVDCGSVALAGSCMQGPVPEVQVTPAQIDFGPLCVGQSADRSLTVINRSNVPVKMTAVSSSHPAFTIIGLELPQTVPANGRVNLAVRMSCTTRGAPSGEIRFTAERDGKPVSFNPARVAVKGTCLEAAATAPPTVEFGPVCVGQSADRAFNVTNSGNTPITISGIGSSNAVFTSATPLPATVPTGGSLTVTVRFHPTTAGLQNSTIRFTASSDCGAVNVGAVAASGVGVIVGCTIEERTVEFGSVAQSADRVFKVANSGEEPFEITKIIIEPAEGIFSVVSPKDAVSVPAGKSVNVRVRMTCQDAAGGEHRAELRFEAQSRYGAVDCGLVTLVGQCRKAQPKKQRRAARNRIKD